MSDSARITSAVNWTVLALVIEQPSYGYELSQRFERRFRGVLEPQVSQIYAALRSLERAELIEPLPAAGELAGREEAVPSSAVPSNAVHSRHKVHYRVTEEGVRAFNRWLAGQLRSDPPHGELLQRLAATAGAGVGQLAVMVELIDRYERACVEEASRLPLRTREPAGVATTEDLVERLVLGARRAVLDARYEWIAYARREVRAFVAEGEGGRDELAGA